MYTIQGNETTLTFTTLEEANETAQKIFNITGAIVGIEETTAPEESPTYESVLDALEDHLKGFQKCACGYLVQRERDHRAHVARVITEAVAS